MCRDTILDRNESNMSEYIKPFSQCKINVYHSPFIYGYIYDFLPAEIYKKLETSFLDPAQSDKTEVFKYGKNRTVFIAPPAPASIPADSPWLGFVEQITNQEYMNDCLQWIRQAYVESVTDTDDLYTKMMMSRFDIEKKELKMQCEFSTLEANTYLEPHTDAENKFISCILYLPTSEWQNSWGGQTEGYKAKDSKYDANWDNRHLPLHQMETIFSCEFRPNRLFFFVKTKNSWHGVSPLSAPSGVQRRTFNFSMRASAEAFDKAPISTFQKQISKHEARIFNDSALKRIFRKFNSILKAK